MKKFLICTVLVFAAAFCGNAQNLVRNGDFKEGGKYWLKTTWTKVTGTVEVKDGTVEITQTEAGQYTMFETAVALKPKTRYTVSFQIKCEGMKTDGKRQNGAGLLILHKGVTFLELSPKGKWNFADGTFDWKTCSDTFTTEDKDGWFSLFLRVHGGVGKAFFSDIKIEEQPDAVKPTASVELQPLIWQNNSFSLAAGFPGCIYAEIHMPPPSGSLSLTVDLPKGISLAGASPWRGNPTSDGSLISDKITVAPSPRKGFSRYIVSVNKKFAATLKPDSMEWRNYYRLFLTADASSAGGTAYLEIDADGKSLIKEQSFKLNVLPEIKMPQPQLDLFKLDICYLFSLNSPDDILRNAYLNFWLGLAKKPITFNVFGFPGYPEEIRRDVNTRFDTILFVGAARTTPLGNLTAWEKKNGVSFDKIILANGKKIDSLCPSFMEDASNRVWNEYLPELVGNGIRFLKKGSPIVWDFEPGAKDFCFCEVCRRKFSDSIGAGKTLTADEITRAYASKWFSFRVRQNTGILKAFSKSIRKHFPDNPVYLCTDPLHSKQPHVAEWCGVDIRELDGGEYDLFMNMPYYEGIVWHDDLAFNLKTLKTPNFPLIDPSEDMEMFYKRYTPEGVFMNMVAAAALGAKGIGFWPGDNFDARYLHSIANASGLIASAQDCYAAERCDSIARVTPENVMKMEISDGSLRKTVSFPDFDADFRYTVHRKDSRVVATVFNYNEKNRLITKIAFPGLENASGYTVTCLNDSAGYPKADVKKGFLAEIPAKSVRIFELSETKRPAATSCTQENMQEKLKIDRKLLSDVNLFKGETNGAESASWGLLPGISAPLVKLSSGSRSVYIHPSANAAAIGYFIDRIEDILSGQSRGVMDDAKIYGFNGALNYKVTALKMENGNPSVTMTASIPVPEDADPNSVSPYGLAIVKKVSLENGGTLLRSVYTLENPAGNIRKITTGLRIKHYPRLGAAWKTNKPLSSFWSLSLNAGNGNIVFKGAETPNHLFLRKNLRKVPDGLSGKIQTADFTGGPAVLRAVNGRQSVSIACSLLPAADFAGIFTWWSTSDASTLEPMSAVKTLGGGEKTVITSDVTVGK